MQRLVFLNISIGTDDYLFRETIVFHEQNYKYVYILFSINIIIYVHFAMSTLLFYASLILFCYYQIITKYTLIYEFYECNLINMNFKINQK